MFCDAVNTTSKSLNISVWAYVIMPEHVHLLVLPNEEDYYISQFLKRVKQSVSRRARSWLAENDTKWLEKLTINRTDGKNVFRFWQAGGGYNRNIIKPSTMWKAVDYIHANPVRRGLVGDPLEWEWSSALDYEGREEGPIHVVRIST